MGDHGRVSGPGSLKLASGTRHSVLKAGALQYWQGQTHRPVEKKNPEIDPHKSSQLSFDKGTKQLNEGRIVFPTNDSRAIEQPYGKKMNPKFIKKKWITDLNVKHKIIKLLEKIGEYL